jgi:succinoglycan biosynthesis transport protein ExoP
MRLGEHGQHRFSATAVLEPIRRRKWILVQAVVLGGLAGSLFVLGEQRRYEATASVLELGQGAATISASAARSDPQDAAAEVALARSPQVVQRVLRQRVAEGISRRSLLAHARVSAEPDRAVVEFRVSDVSPGRAQALATAYARAFAGVRAELAGADARAIVTPAAGAEQVAPRPVRTIGEGLVAGVLGGLLLLFALEALDQRVRRVVEVSRALDLPLLGAPRAPSRPLSDLFILRDDPYDEAAEAYRILRANLELATVDPRIRVIMVTGALDGDGRTTTTANLAIACALAGRRVALVDLSLRYPALQQVFGLQGHPGLTDVVLDHFPLATTLVQVDLEQAGSLARVPMRQPGELDVLVAGPEPVDPAEVIGSPRLADLIEELRAGHDLVLLDAPPLLPVGDALLLSTVADASIVVTNLALLRRPMLSQLRCAVRACAAIPLGFVATGVGAAERDRSGGYYYERRTRRPRGAIREWAA